LDEEGLKKQYGVRRWVRDLPFREAWMRLAAQPTVNIEGLVGGYTGPGGKTVLPHRALAKLDLRLVPDMTVDDCLKKLRAHLDKRGFADVEINVGGAYPPNTTAADAPAIRAEVATYRKYGTDPLLWPRLGGSWPGYLFTEPPLRLGAGHFGMGHGAGAHAPDEYYVVESTNPKIQGLAVVRRLLVRDRVLTPRTLFEAAHHELVRAATDGLGEDGESRLLDAFHVAEVEGEVAHALADQTRNRGGAFAVQLAA